MMDYNNFSFDDYEFVFRALNTLFIPFRQDARCIDRKQLTQINLQVLRLGSHM